MENLKEILIKVIDHLNNSVESDWSSLTPKEVVKNLEIQIVKLERNEKIDRDLLEVEFAPTSTIQEISMANGWSDEYLKLSSKFDKEINKK
ncbi:hypothetical protein [Aquimarina algiphila]|uniref:hypothetical protein n=1 Tax=Aquimarina algiphila TaxID=2047982 RepID=UPI00232E216E|nr:hypothetical protein [Aquimarina algiphila]